MYIARISVVCLLILLSTTLYGQAGLEKFDINTGFSSSYPLHITLFGSKVAFYANNGSKGWELYTQEGSNAPVLSADMNPLAGSAIGLYFNKPIATIGSKLYFTADNGLNGTELFSYNGSSTPLMTPEIEAGTAGSSPDDFAVLNGNLYFRANTSTEGYELWMYNPSLNQHTRLTDLKPAGDSSITGNITAFAGKIYFTADSLGGNNELWMYDPISNTATMVHDINAGVAASNPKNLIVINNKLYFSAEEAATGRELYVYTGTGLPQRLTDLVAGSFNGIPDMQQPLIAGFNNKVYFTGSDAATLNQLYVYDPATGNTTFAASTNGTGTSEPQWLTEYGGKLYFTAYNDTTGIELWAYDGTSAPTLVLDLCKGTTGSTPQQLVVMGDDLYFRANDCNGVGEELLRYNYKKLSVQDALFAADVNLYPNPAIETATLQMKLQKPAILLVELRDMQGRIVYTTGTVQYPSGNQHINLPLATLAAGNYQCNIVSATGKRFYSSKLTVQ
ncbi:hypothetical protein CAP35_13415 [Chitinophagaceae bacterium IBVUCB1]|nr:hypothetical protein CAP35_13415 [Chitinophagaceae bacterium IBVUCB1]